MPVKKARGKEFSIDYYFSPIILKQVDSIKPNCVCKNLLFLAALAGLKFCLSCPILNAIFNHIQEFR